VQAEFKSNAREIWCVILVSVNWHIHLRLREMQIFLYSFSLSLFFGVCGIVWNTYEKFKSDLFDSDW